MIFSPLWNLGFRPFFLLAGGFAVVALLLWASQLAGIGAAYHGSAWHAHEMVFGYTLAVIVGFLFTAVRNWTGQPTPRGIPLMGIAGLWLAGRLLAFTPGYAWSGVADAAFTLAAAVGIGVPLWRSGNRRNFFMAGLLLAFGADDLAFILADAGQVPWAPENALRWALDLVLLLMVIMGGRVIPMFTANAMAGVQTRRVVWLERAALGSVLGLFLLDLLPFLAFWQGLLSLLAMVLHGGRLWLWQPWRTLKVPLLWILHAAYAWIVLHLGLRALALWGVLPMDAATHALTVGGIGALTLGMMTRVSRGHTGRPLVVGAMERWAYGLILLAALVRQMPGVFVRVSGLLWGFAFLLFVLRYFPILTTPRIDGRDG